MAVTYDPALIALSLVIAVFGAHTGLWLAARMDGAIGVARKALLAGAAIAIGGGIWSMHFVGMLALSLPVTITYDVLLTLISALLSILVTGVGLAVVGSGTPGWPRLAVGGVFMGGGIAIMHYVGMAAVRANCVILWDRGLIGASVLIAVAAATAALWTAFARTGPKRRVAASVVLGLAIAGMHYTGMAAATFLPADVLIALAAPALSPSLLAIVVAVATFLIFGFTLLTAVPDRSPAPASAPVPLPAGAAVPEALTPAAPEADDPAVATGADAPPVGAATPPLVRIPVVQNRQTLFLDPAEVVSIQAEAHYTHVHTREAQYFCTLSVSELEQRLDPASFLRVHRSHIVNIRHARAFRRRNDQGVLVVDDADGRTVPVSRGNVRKLRAALGF
ncbi:MAG: hypothetical protein GVY27_05050 [Deinococcus-Thermus bacterium]|jgi:NO-binding membrane sensor protein with MHYT domain|nr:hypothetical protein [Deinococcota bacterium]